MFRIDLSGVAYREEGWWLAHCLQLDIIAEGTTPQEAFRSLQSLCDLQLMRALEEGDLASVLRPAPPEIWHMYYMATDAAPQPVKEPAPKERAPINRFEMRQMAHA